MFYFYLLRCKDGSLYSGSTNNIKRREELHNAGGGSKYVRSRSGGKIVYFEKFRTRAKAMSREAEIKRKNKAFKENLIKSAECQ
jgi:putative endonuclease